MYIESVPNRNSPAAVLLRESYREDGKVRKRTLANLSCLPEEVIEGLKVLLRGGVAVPSVEEVFTVERTLPHGHVAAVLGAARGSGATSWFGSAPQELQPVLLAMLVARVISPEYDRPGMTSRGAIQHLIPALSSAFSSMPSARSQNSSLPMRLSGRVESSARTGKSNIR